MALKTNPATNQYEFEFTQQDFEALRNIVTTQTGIELPDNKKTLMYTRLVRRLRTLSLSKFSEYVQHIQKQLEAKDTSEMMIVVNSMTTNVTAFFREQHHFENLAQVLPELYKKFGAVYIWSAASSTGEEPWSIAMVVKEFMEKHNITKNIQIYATDIDMDVIQKARDGIYSLNPDDVNSNPYLKKYLQPLGHAEESKLSGHNASQDFRIKDSIRPLVKYKKTNLLQEWGIPQKHIHVVFCRNVIIYFSKETQRGIFTRMSKLMPPESILYIGHSESLINVSDQYENTGRTAYVKK